MLETYQNMPSPITFKSDDSVVYFLQFSRVFQFNLNTTTMPGSKSGAEKGAGGRRGSRMSRGSRVSQKSQIGQIQHLSKLVLTFGQRSAQLLIIIFIPFPCT